MHRWSGCSFTWKSSTPPRATSPHVSVSVDSGYKVRHLQLDGVSLVSITSLDIMCASADCSAGVSLILMGGFHVFSGSCSSRPTSMRTACCRIHVRHLGPCRLQSWLHRRVSQLGRQSPASLTSRLHTAVHWLLPSLLIVLASQACRTSTRMMGGLVTSLGSN